MEKETSNFEFNFELKDKDKPDIVIENSLAQIEEKTRGYVVGKIRKYDGHVYSYTKTVRHGGLNLESWDEEKMVDIQDSLGAQDEKEYKFEVFLSVRGLPHYKYRIMFVRYTSISYPVSVVMNEDVAIACTGKRNTALSVDSADELQNIIDTIIKSRYMRQLLQSLINESLREEDRMRKKAASDC